MSNRIFQAIIHQMRTAVDRTIGVLDENSMIISCTDLTKIGDAHSHIDVLSIASGELVVRGGYTYKNFGTHQAPEYCLFVEGEDDIAGQFAGMLSIALSGIKQFYDEKFDRANFIKNVILDNILPSDIYVKAREMHFNSDVVRVVLLVRVLSANDVSVYDVLQSLFPDRQKDFLFTISESDILLVKEIKNTIKMRDVEKLARSIDDTLAKEYLIKVNIGIGTVVEGVKDLARSFKEAQVALEVGKVFDTEKRIISYDNLGIARLIYQLPTTLCEMYLREVFKKGSIESLDYETLFTIQKFFENNLNVSETSRKLFVHRNTLVYRLEKIKKLTGLDLREFDHAIIFKVALMVKKYLTSSPVKY